MGTSGLGGYLKSHPHRARVDEGAGLLRTFSLPQDGGGIALQLSSGPAFPPAPTLRITVSLKLSLSSRRMKFGR